MHARQINCCCCCVAPLYSANRKKLLDKCCEMTKVIVFVTCRFFLSLVKALWTKNGGCIVYPCHAIVVSMDVSSGQQQFFMGHTDKVWSKSYQLCCFYLVGHPNKGKANSIYWCIFLCFGCSTSKFAADYGHFFTM